MEPTFDIQTPTQQRTTAHTGRKVIVIVTIVIIVAALVILAVRTRAKRIRDAYRATPEGQLEALRAVTEPITSTREERAVELANLQTGSDVSLTPEQQLEELNTIRQQ